MILETILGILLIGIYISWTMIKKWNYWKNKGVHEVTFKRKEHFNDTLKRHAEETKGLPYYGSYLIGRKLLFVTDVDLVKHITIKDFEYFMNRGDTGRQIRKAKTNQFVDKLWFKNMFDAVGDNWKNIRSTFTPIFTTGKIKAMFVFMQETCKRLTNALDEIADNDESFEVKEILGKYSMDTIASCVFGVDGQIYTNEKSEFVKNASNMFKTPSTIATVCKSMLGRVPFGIGIYLMRLFNISFNPNKTEIEFFYNVVIDTLRSRQKSGSRRNDLIDLMLDAVKGEISEEKDHNAIEQFEKDANLNHTTRKGELDEIVIVATAILMLIAGYDTTATTLSFALYELAMNPDIQEKLRDEVDNITSDNKQLTYNDLQSMTYLDQIISETLRYHLSLGQGRYTLKDYKVPGHDLVIEEGTLIIINTFAIHSDPIYYANSKQFDPEHFSKESKSSRNPYAYLPFGQGPRNCIGMRFALLEAKLALASIIQRYHLTPSDKTADVLEQDPKTVMPYAKGGLHIKLERRN